MIPANIRAVHQGFQAHPVEAGIDLVGIAPERGRIPAAALGCPAGAALEDMSLMAPRRRTGRLGPLGSSLLQASRWT